MLKIRCCADLYRAYSFWIHENVLSEEYNDSYISCVPDVIEYINRLYDVIYKTRSCEAEVYARTHIHK